MHEVYLQSVALQVLFVLKQVVLRGHVVTLVPVGLPLTKNRKSWLESERNMVFFAEGMRGRNISNVIIVVEAMDVLRERYAHAADCTLPMVRVDLREVVNSAELTVDTSRLVENIEVLIDSD